MQSSFNQEQKESTHPFTLFINAAVANGDAVKVQTAYNKAVVMAIMAHEADENISMDVAMERTLNMVTANCLTPTPDPECTSSLAQNAIQQTIEMQQLAPEQHEFFQSLQVSCPAPASNDEVNTQPE
jgi:hypothetical protein